MKALKAVLFFLFVVAASAQTMQRAQGWCEQGGQLITVLTYQSSLTTPVQRSYPDCTVTVYATGSETVSAGTYVSGGTIAGGAGQTVTLTFNGGINGVATATLTGPNTIAAGAVLTINTGGSGFTLPPTTAVCSNGTATCSGTVNVTTVTVGTLATIYSDSSSTPLANPFTGNSFGYWYFYFNSPPHVDVQLSNGNAVGIATPFTILGDYGITMTGGPGASFYQTMSNSSSVSVFPQEPTLNFSSEFTLADDPVGLATDVSINTIAEGKITSLIADLAAKLPINNPAWTGTMTTPFTSSGVQCVEVDALGQLAVTGLPCGTGSGGANASGYYLVGQALNEPANAINLGALASGFVYSTVTGGVSAISTNPFNTCTPLTLLGFALSGSDETTLLNTTLSNLNTAGGGCIFIDAGKTLTTTGQVNFPYGAGPSYPMAPITILGSGSSRAFSDNSVQPYPGSSSFWNATYAGNRLQVLGQGTVTIKGVTFKNTSNNCGIFIYSTLANMIIRENTFIGNMNVSGTSSCDDAWWAGGTNPPNGTFVASTAQYYQGYGSIYDNNQFSHISRIFHGGVAVNGLPITNNTVDFFCGSSETTVLASVTAGNPTTITFTDAPGYAGNGRGIGFQPLQTIYIQLTGLTGTWAPLNGIKVATVTGRLTATVPVNSTSFGTVTGTPAYYSGAPIEFDGVGQFYNAGNEIFNNILETRYYAYGVKLASSTRNFLRDNSCWDSVAGSSPTIACYRFEWDADNNHFNVGYTSVPFVSDGAWHGNAPSGQNLADGADGAVAFTGTPSAYHRTIIGAYNAALGTGWQAPVGGYSQYHGDLDGGSGLVAAGGIENIIDATKAATQYVVAGYTGTPLSPVFTNLFTVWSSGRVQISNSYTPATSSATCTIGMVSWDASYWYVCYNTNSWKRISLVAF